jgi:hypothetical protein
MHVRIRLCVLEQPRHCVLPPAFRSAPVYDGGSDNRTPEIELRFEYFPAGRFRRCIHEHVQISQATGGLT